MTTSLRLPGSPHHQALLQMITEVYERDDRVVALLVFGSVGRGTWDSYSDLDLSIVIQDRALIDIANELERLKMAFDEQGEQTLFTEVAGNDGYLLLQSLHGVALSYHSLQSITPYVLEGWQMLHGTLDEEMICAAAKANDHPHPLLSQQMHRVLWLALGLEIALQRGQFWCALSGLESMRGALLDIFAASRGGKRSFQIFEEAASAEMKAKFGNTLPQHYSDSFVNSIHSLRDAFLTLLHVIEYELAELSNGQIHLGVGEIEVITRLRARQAIARNNLS